MIHYEVTMTVQLEAFDKMLLWLQNEHIHEVLAEPGFVQAELLLEDSHLASLSGTESSHRRLRVVYFSDSEDKLRAYLSEKAPALRQKGLQLFPNLFSAQRAFWAAPNTGPRLFHPRADTNSHEHD